MKYKYTRKELVDAWLKYRNIEGDFGRNLKDDLLAQKEDKKEINYCQVGKPQKPVKCTVTCTGGEFKFYKTLPPTHSPLEIEEIEEMKVNKLSYASYNQWAKIMNKINSLISNQKKLYQFIKDKL